MMIGSARRWIEPEQDRQKHRTMAQQLGLQAATVSVLLNRGILTPEAVRSFLNPSESDLLDPMRLIEMDRAASRIRMAIRRSERVVVYGDYDVDGVTATTLYWDFFNRQGLLADYYIPHRLQEGYGLNEPAIRTIHRQGATLIITADCGTTSVDEIRLARSLGIDVIVTDHHEVPAELPPATAILNPKRTDAGYPEKGLCTAGLAFKVIQAVTGRFDADGLDLVALGTIADVCPVTGENRFLVKEGLRRLTEAHRPGIRALKEAAGLNEPKVGTGTVGFILAPRINAAGRLGDAREAVRLLTTRSWEEAQQLARSLNDQNQMRQQAEEAILTEACRRVESEIDREEGCIILASREWHLGVIGIVAARLAERYYRPTILLAIDSMGLAKGSARSIAGFHLYEGLRRCQDLLVRFGGHRSAAGLVLREEQIPTFRKRFSGVVREMLGPEDFQPRLMIDSGVDWEEMSLRLVDELDRLAPFGPANPEPTLILREAIPVGARIVGNNHLKFSAAGGNGISMDAIGFRMGDRMGVLQDGSRVDLVFTPERNVWQGRERIQLRLKDIRPAKTGRC